MKRCNFFRKKTGFRLITVLLSALFAAGAAANIRAPYGKNYQASQTLATSSKNLTVLREELAFDCGAPYEGALDRVLSETKTCRITAEYLILAGTAGAGRFEFIMPDKNSVLVSVNSTRAAADDPVIIQSGRQRNALLDDIQDRYSVAFNAALIDGENRIRVEYLQPVSVMEKSYGYFSESKWLSSVRYELWPLKSWELSKNFSMNIKVRMNDDSGFFSRLFGGKNAIAVLGSDRGGTNQSPVETGILERKGEILEYTCTLGRTFPDSVIVLYGPRKYVESR